MNRLNIALAIIGMGLALLLLNNNAGTTFGMNNDDFARVVYLLPLALVMSAGIWASRHTASQSLRNLLVWLVVILGLATVYIYRNDATAFGDRLLAGLVPGHAVVVTTSEGSQEVILHTLLNGHFEAEVAINGHPIDMLVDTGASTVALSQEDAQRIGITPENLTYTMTVLTANGRARAAPVELDSIAIGPIRRNGVEAMVAEEGKLDQSLLGMSFLETLGSMQMQTDELRLRD